MKLPQALKDKHVCFVSANSYPLFTDDAPVSIGGVETRSLHLARLMRGHFGRVTFAIRKTEGKVINDRGLNVERYEPAIISDKPNCDIADINADAYVVFESHPYTSDVVRTCNIINRPVVHFCTHDIEYIKDCNLGNEENYYADWPGRESAYSFYYADRRVCQTEQQQRSLRENHGLEAVVVRNPIDVPPVLPVKNSCTRPTVLWVGRTDPVFKRPSILISIAQKLASVNFIMIMNKTNDQMYNDISASKPPNVKLVEYVPFDRMSEIYESCGMFLSTSFMEGFPNVFLQAMCHGLPVISLEVDPDGLFSEKKCGITCEGRLEKAVESILSLSSDTHLRNEISRRAFEYVKSHHATAIVENQLADILGSLFSTPKKWIQWTAISYNENTCRALRAEYQALQARYRTLQDGHQALLNSRPVRCVKLLKKLMGLKGRNG